MRRIPTTLIAVLLLLPSVLLFSYDYNPHTLCGASADGSSAYFTVNGTNATMRGYIDGNTPGRVDALIANNPEVDTIIMENVPGSDNDTANLQAARKVRDAGLATHVPSGGLIASGGVDFFLAGALRTIDPSYCGVEVHTWAYGNGTLGSSLARSHPDHQPYLSYYREMGIAEDFYWFTLDAPRHPSTDTYNMNPTDIDFWGLEGVGGPRILQPVAAPVSDNAVAKAALNNKIKKLKKKAKKAKKSGKVAKAKKFKAKIKKLAKKLRAL